MKKNTVVLFAILMVLCLTGCSNNKDVTLAENIKKIELTGNLVTYTAYYHNVVEYEKEKGSGIAHILEKDRKLFIEYTGTIKLGIDLSKVKITTEGYKINVFIPKASVIGEPNVDLEDFKEENFIEDKDGINKNPITADDSSAAFEKAQQEMKENADSSPELLSLAQKRAKAMIEENINQFSGMSEKQYEIEWEFGV